MYDELVKALRRLGDWSIMDFEDNLSYANQIAEEAADAIEELSATISKMEKATRWIPVSERLPEENAPCIVYNKDYGPMVGWRIDGKRFRIPGSFLPDHPTHWMPLPQPKPPKEEEA